MFSFGKENEPEIVTDEATIKEVLSRFVTEIIDREHLHEKMKSGKRLRIKLGIDPTSPNLHLGRAIPLLKLRDFQQLGHQIVLIIGNATGVIGDTSDKESERPMLKRNTVEENAKTYFEQAKLLLDMNQVEVHRNAEWLDKLSYREIGEQADQFSVADFIARDNIRRRLDAGTRVSLREVLYPLMQGYDSVAVRADVEIGGTDQRFNLLAGRPLQTFYGQEPQDILMNELIPGTDGRKMSSSWGNTINLTDEPHDMYGKVMRVSDEMMPTYFEACTRVPQEEIEKSLSGNPRDAKMRLAREIVTLYHGENAASNAEEQFVKTFQEKGTPDEMQEVRVAADSALGDVLAKSGVVASKTEFRRLVSEGAVHNVETGEKIEDAATTVTTSMTLKIGKRRFVRIEVK